MTPPLIQKNIYSNDIEVPDLVSGQWFFEFFERKRIKMALAFAASLIGALGNFHAVRYQITQTRFDMVGMDNTIDIYAFGLTAMLEIAIIFFHLTRINFLTWVSTISAILISIYANVNLMIQNQSINTLSTEHMGGLNFGGSFVIGITQALLPLIILHYLMFLVMLQYDKELKRAINAKEVSIEDSMEDSI